tara:strand:- start:8906 stop:10174 length:1269 start_codon:yes stop_codon:yes gene_type:complete
MTKKILDINILNKDFQDGKNIFIFGADVVGKVVMKILEENQIFIKGFLDNNKNKCYEKISNLPVEHAPKKLLGIEKNSIILIASTYILDIINQLESYGIYEWYPITGILEKNNSVNYDSYIKDDLQKNYSGGVFTKDFVNFGVTNMIASQKKYLDPDKLFIRSMDIIVTEKCSLKCKDCSNLMQYYERPINIDGSELLNDYEDLNAVSDEVNEIRIIGGEPLMNKDFHEITAKAASYEKFNKVVVYTNGTICPNDEKLEKIKNEKTFVFITTYGELSRNAKKLADSMERLGINYNIQPAYGWTDSGKVKDYKRPDKINKNLFKLCCAKHFTTLTDGKIFRCPFSANLERLKALPKSTEDYFDIRNSRNINDLSELKIKLKWFLRDKDLINACNFCHGRSYGQPEIEPGIQTKKVIEYASYPR